MTRRTEFTVKTKKAALKRSGGLCEAEGAFYGLEEGQRCNASLGPGVEFDHIVEDGFGGDSSLDNCGAVCPPCHRIKTNQGVKRMRKADRQGKPRSMKARKGRPMAGTKASGIRKRMNGDVERWT